MLIGSSTGYPSFASRYPRQRWCPVCERNAKHYQLRRTVRRAPTIHCRCRARPREIVGPRQARDGVGAFRAVHRHARPSAPLRLSVGRARAVRGRSPRMVCRIALFILISGNEALRMASSLQVPTHLNPSRTFGHVARQCCRARECGPRRGCRIPHHFCTCPLCVTHFSRLLSLTQVRAVLVVAIYGNRLFRGPICSGYRFETSTGGVRFTQVSCSRRFRFVSYAKCFSR